MLRGSVKNSNFASGWKNVVKAGVVRAGFVHDKRSDDKILEITKIIDDNIYNL